MITSKVIEATRDLVSSASYREVTVAAKANTPLSILNNVTAQIVVPESTEMIADSTISAREKSLIEASTRVDPSGDERHSSELGTLAKFISTKVSNSLNYARNVINPLVKEVLADISTAQEEASRFHRGERNIIIVDPDPIYYDGILDSLITKAKTKASDAKPLSKELAENITSDITIDVFLKTIKLNSSGFDNAVLDLWNTLSDDVRSNIIGYGNFTYPISDIASNLRVYTDHSALFSYLFLHGVKNGNLDYIDVNSLSAEERIELSKAIEYYGFLINYQIDKYADDNKNNRIISSVECIPTESIYVIGKAYRTWLNTKGGSPEAILGIMVNNPKFISLEQNADLYNNAAKYKTIYDRYSKTIAAEDRVNSNAIVDKVLRQNLYKFILSEYGDDVIQARRELQEKLDSTVSNTPYNHAIPLDMHVLRTVCTVLGTDKNDSFEIITAMRAYLIDNPDATTQEAALVAACKIVGRWASSQVCVRPY